MSDQKLRILHTAAHPADSFDLAGGTLAHHVERGDKVTVVAFSHGVMSHDIRGIEARRGGRRDDVTRETTDESIIVKEREVIDACRILGIEDVRFLRHDDDVLLVQEGYVRELALVIRDVRPDVMITHNPFEYGGVPWAHRSCVEITLLARQMASGIMRDDDSPPHKVGEVFFVWQTGFNTLLDWAVPRFPAIYIDVTDVTERKVKALDCLKSQMYDGALGRKMLEANSGAAGYYSRVPYAEVFVREFPEVQRYLPVCEHNLKLARRPRREIINEAFKFIVPHVPSEC